MNKIKKFLLVFVMVVLLCGCTKNTTEEKKEKVTDETVITAIKNQITALESLDKTEELYKKGEGKSEDYTNEDKLRYGLEARISSAAVTALTPTEIQYLASRNILNVTSYVDSSEVSKYIGKNFASSTVDFVNLSGCPAYYFDSNNSRFYIQTQCVSQDTSTIYSYIDSVEMKDNVYYVTVYAGLSDGTNLYNDFNKSKVVVDITSNQEYTISDNDKKDYTVFTYKFEKNTNGDYIFKEFNK